LTVTGLGTLQAKPATVLLKFTVPAGVPAPGDVGEIWANKVMAWPETAGEADGVTITRVEAVSMAVTEASALSALVLKLVSPEYTAWTVARAVDVSPNWTEHVAVAVPPLPDTVTEAQDDGRTTPPPRVSVNATVPVGVTTFPVTGFGFTVAVNTTV